jgi:DNA repair exonuclease SbcCD ATPase subunit
MSSPSSVEKHIESNDRKRIDRNSERLAALESDLKNLKARKVSCDERMDSIEKQTDLKIDALREATTLAKQTMDERLARMNEFRDALRDQNVSFFTKAEHEQFAEKVASDIRNVKAEYEAYKERIGEDIRSLRESRAELSGKASQADVNKATSRAELATAIAIISTIIGAIGVASALLRL